MTKKFFLTIAFVNIGLLVVQFGLSCRRAAQSVNLAAKEETILRLETENSVLKNEIFTYSSLRSISDRAYALNLTPGKPSFLVPPAVAVANSLTGRQ